MCLFFEIPERKITMQARWYASEYAFFVIPVPAVTA
jgi:hypothetical protein